MKFEVDKNIFEATLSRAKGAVSRQDTMPVLRNVMLRPMGENRIEMTATDLELSIRIAMEVRALEGGAAGMTLPAKEALGIVRSFSDERISVELLENHKVKIMAGKSRRALPSIPCSDFPAVPPHDQSTFLQCDRTALIRALNTTLYAVPPNGDAYSVSGVFVSRHDPETYRFASSDGHRVAFMDLPDGALSGITIGSGIVIPYSAMTEILKLMDREGPAHIAIEDGRLWIKTAEAVLGVQLLVSDRPEFEAIIPNDRPFKLSVDSEVLRDVLKSMAVLCSGKYQAIELRITGETMALRLCGESLGEADDEIRVEYEGADEVLFLNLRYLAEVAEAMGAGKIRMEWVNGMNPVVLVRPEDRSVMHLVMPVVV